MVAKYAQITIHAQHVTAAITYHQKFAMHALQGVVHVQPQLALLA
jgi:hypothetical protein